MLHGRLVGKDTDLLGQLLTKELVQQVRVFWDTTRWQERTNLWELSSDFHTKQTSKQSLKLPIRSLYLKISFYQIK